MRKNDGAFLVFKFFNEDINFLTNLDGFRFQKFIERNDAFALVADVHEDFFRAEFDDGAFDDLALSDEFTALFQGLFHGQHNLTG